MNDFEIRGHKMLTEERQNSILAIVEKKGSATVQELMQILDASESTIRRDLNAMDAKGLLVKVFGGAIAKNSFVSTTDEEFVQRKLLHQDKKDAIVQYAASLIEDHDFIYLDAGTTTEVMIDYLKAKEAVFVTNAVGHAKKLSEKGYDVYILGGQFKSTTEAIVGEEAVLSLDKYQFTKGFFGTNGIDSKKGYTTPEVKEAMVKKQAMENCQKSYVLADESKFSVLSSVKFGEFDQATIITNQFENQWLKEEYRKYGNIKEADL